MRLLFYILFFLSINVSFSYADSVPVVNKKQWTESAGKYNFRENFREPKPKKKKPFLPNMELIRKIIIAIIIIGLAIIIIILITRILKNASNKVKENTTLTEVIENIETADLESMLNKSVENKSFKDAIRYRYLILLKLLNEKKFIQWKKDKTNGHYIIEMAGKSGFELFRYVTIRFEYFWYGENSVEEKDYNNTIPLFDKMNNLLSRNE